MVEAGRKSGVLLFILTLMLVTGCCIAIQTQKIYAANDTMSYTCQHVNGNAVYTVGDKIGCSAQQDAAAIPKGTAEKTVIRNSSTIARIAYWYGVRKGWFNKDNQGTTKGKMVKRMIQYQSMGGSAWRKAYKDDGYSSAWISSIEKKVTEYIKTAKTKTVPDAFIIWKGTVSEAQDFVVWEYTPAYLGLIKGTSDPKVLGYGYNFEGIEYTVYKDADCTDEAGALVCTSGGRTNTLTLGKGTYYIRETKSNDFFEKCSDIKKVTLAKGQRLTLPADEMSDTPLLGSAEVSLSITDDESEDTFSFILQGADENISDWKTDFELGAGGTYTVEDLPQGKYKLSEMPSCLGDYEDITGSVSFEILVPQESPVKLKYENRKQKEGSLLVTSETEDRSPAQGFKYKVTGELENQGTLTEDDILDSITPQDEEQTEEEDYDIENAKWSLDQDDIDTINEAAKKSSNSGNTYEIKATATADLLPDVEEEGEELPQQLTLTAMLTVTLKDVGFDDSILPDGGYEATIENVSDNSFDWFGCATVYRYLGEGDAYTILTTDSDGYGYMQDDDARKKGIRPVFPGTYKVEQQLSDTQKKLYIGSEDLEAQLNEDSAIAFHFINTARKVPVSLRMVSEYNDVSGSEFTLTGTDAAGEKVEKNGILTDTEGKLTLGSLFPGEYILEETSFDPENYENNHQFSGYDSPVIKFTLSVNDEGEWKARVRQSEDADEETQSGDIFDEDDTGLTISFAHESVSRLYITKIDSESGLFLEDAEFSLLDSAGSTVAKFSILENDDGSAGIKMIQAKDGIKGKYVKEAINDGEEDPGDDPDNDGVNDGSEEANGIFDADPEDAEEINTDDDPAESTPPSTKYALIKGLTIGDKYTLKETKAPRGYEKLAVVDFTFEDRMSLTVENDPVEIGTVAKDETTGLHQGNAVSPAGIVDTVAYRNLIGGKEYEIRGTLMYQGRNTADAEYVILSGNLIQASTRFTADMSGSGSVDVTFNFDGSKLSGKSVVAFESLYVPVVLIPGDPIATHEEVADEHQTVDYPKISTSAAAKDTSDHITYAGNNVTITDVVSFENLVAGQEYEMKGFLMDKAAGRVAQVNGKQITATQHFTPQPSGKELAEGEIERVSGTVNVKFTFDARTLAGHSLVAYEDLYIGDKLIGEHKDLSEQEQTVQIAQIKTKASLSSKSVIKDTVTYSNLIPSKRYTMYGRLVFKDSEKTVEGAEAKTDFCPTKASGNVTLKFEIEPMELATRAVVAYEECYVAEAVNGTEKEILIADHKALTDSSQTVIYPIGKIAVGKGRITTSSDTMSSSGGSKSSKASDSGSGSGSSESGSSGSGSNGSGSSSSYKDASASTGEDISLLLWILLMAGAALTAIGILIFRRKRENA